MDDLAGSTGDAVGGAAGTLNTPGVAFIAGVGKEGIGVDADKEPRVALLANDLGGWGFLVARDAVREEGFARQAVGAHDTLVGSGHIMGGRAD